MEICEQEVDWGMFSDQHLSGSKGSRTQQRERVSCLQSQQRSQPAGSFGPGRTHQRCTTFRQGRRGLCTSTSASHWVQFASKEA